MLPLKWKNEIGQKVLSTDMKSKILAEDKHILVCHKPVGLAVQSGRVGEADMVSELKNYLAAGGKTPYLGLIHRLDQPVSGILVFAKTPQAAAELSRQAAGEENSTVGSGRPVSKDKKSGMKKEYRALVYLTEGVSLPAVGEKRVLEDYLLKDGRENTSRVVQPETEGAKKSVLEFETERIMWEPDGKQGCAQIRIQLMTGRHHQIRVQCANAGIPLLGDSRYGSMTSRNYSLKKKIRTVALCAWKLSFIHPVSQKQLEFELEELPWKV